MIEHVCPATDLALAWDPKRKTVLDHVQAHDAKGGVNWGYFSTSDGAPAGRVVLDGREVWGATGREWPMVALRNGLLVLMTESVPAHDCTWAAAAGPIIVLNRQISRSGWNAFASARLDSPAERIVIGARKGGTEAVIRIYTHQTAETVAREMIAAGCDWAVLGDGGGSATWVRDGRQLHPIGTARRVPTAILWGAKQGWVPDPDDSEPTPGQSDDVPYVGPVKSLPLAKNFNLTEFASRDTDAQVIVSLKLVDLLQRLRDRIAEPLYINSGYRTVAHNRSVNGATYSQHLYGRAADVWAKGRTVDQLANLAREIGFTGILRYKTFVHLDVRAGERVERDYR